MTRAATTLPRGLHPADLAAQQRINAQLIDLRRDLFQFRPGEYARLAGVTPATLWRMEHPDRVNMQILSVERRAAPLGRALDPRLVGLPDVEDDLMVSLLAARRPVDVTKRAANIAALTVARLSAVRLELNLTVAEVSERMGIRQQSLSLTNATAGATAQLSTLQRYTRALGGRLALPLVPLTTP